MAQWIPKTAWKVSNLNKRYGQQYVTQSDIGSSISDVLLKAHHQVHQQSGGLGVFAQLKNLPSGTQLYPGTVVIDVRDDTERKLQPLPTSIPAVALHPHDILSGAANAILPWNKREAHLILVTSSSQRAVSSCAALQRWGYSQVSVASCDSNEKAEVESAKESQEPILEEAARQG